MSGRIASFLGRLTAIIGLSALIAGCFLYQNYLSAIVWHIIHHNKATIANHWTTLPPLWKEDQAADYDTIIISRATKVGSYSTPKITVSPALSGQIRGTDQDELEAVQQAVSASNREGHGNVSSSLLIVRAQKMTFYCKNDISGQPIPNLFTILMCQTPGIPYTFLYDGPINRLNDVTAILSGIQ